MSQQKRRKPNIKTEQSLKPPTLRGETDHSKERNRFQGAP